MKPEKEIDALSRKYQRVAKLLAKIEWVLQGTITERIDKRVVRKIVDGEKVYARYFQWTFKQQGKTVTVSLTPSQAKIYGKAISNQRKVENILDEMRAISREFLDATTLGVKRRK